MLRHTSLFVRCSCWRLCRQHEQQKYLLTLRNGGVWGGAQRAPGRPNISSSAAPEEKGEWRAYSPPNLPHPPNLRKVRYLIRGRPGTLWVPSPGPPPCKCFNRNRSAIQGGGSARTTARSAPASPV